MEKRRYIWLLTAQGDAAGLQDRLNRLAAQGWELEKRKDGWCYLGRLQPTERTELSYLVESAALLSSHEDLKRLVDLRVAEGWEAVCTVNGMHIYRSLPCRSAKSCQPPAENRQTVNIRMTLQHLVMLVTLAAAFALEHLSPQWYLTHLSAFCFLTQVILAAGSLYMAVWSMLRLFQKQETPVKPMGVLIRAVIVSFTALWWQCLGVFVVLTLLPPLWTAELLAGGAVLWLLLRLPLSLVSGVVLAVAFFVSVSLQPFQGEASVRDSAWQKQLSGIVTAEELGLDGNQFVYAEYQTQHSLLVNSTYYTEKWTDMRIESRCYTCFSEWFAQTVEQDIQAAYPAYTVTRQGTQVLALWTSADLSDSQIEKTAQRILTER